VFGFSTRAWLTTFFLFGVIFGFIFGFTFSIIFSIISGISYFSLTLSESFESTLLLDILPILVLVVYFYGVLCRVDFNKYTSIVVYGENFVSLSTNMFLEERLYFVGCTDVGGVFLDVLYFFFECVDIVGVSLQ
jgi:hypothetical protein